MKIVRAIWPGICFARCIDYNYIISDHEWSFAEMLIHVASVR